MSSYLLYPPNPAATHRLFLLPYAGGGASVGSAYRNKFSEKIDVLPIQLPGRENRITEMAFTDMSTLVGELSLEIAPYLDLPYFIWGHCFGALIGFELGHTLDALFKIPPELLIVSACDAPAFSAQTLPTCFYQLSDHDFIDAIEQLMKGAFLHHNDQTSHAVNMLLSGLRADFTLYETYQYATEKKLTCPIIAFSSTKDKLVTPAQTARWESYTTGTFTTAVIENESHYFIHTSTEYISRTLNLYFDQNFGIETSV